MARRIGPDLLARGVDVRFTELAAGDPGSIDAAAEQLQLGGLLAHPTGGVYGIGGPAGPAIEEEVARLKGRSPEAGLVYLAGGVDALGSSFPGLRWTPLADVLAGRFWPGPLTLVLEDGSDQGVAVRVEPHPVTRAVLRRFGRAMSSTSLNLSGEPPAVDADSARRVLAAMPATERPVLFLNAGRLPGPPPSTLVRVPGREGAAWDLLREGAITATTVSAATERGNG